MPSSHLILCCPLFLLLWIFPRNRVFFPMSWLFTSGSKSIWASTSASVLPMNIQDWLPLGLTSLISLLSKGFSSVFSSTTIWKHQFFVAQPSLWCNYHIPKRLLEKPYFWIYRPLLTKWCLCFLIRCLVLSVFLPRIVSFNFVAAVTICSDIGIQGKKICHCFHFSSIYLPWSDGTRCHDSSFLECWILNKLFHSLLFSQNIL